jgi:hypothetical protein
MAIKNTIVVGGCTGVSQTHGRGRTGVFCFKLAAEIINLLCHRVTLFSAELLYRDIITNADNVDRSQGYHWEIEGDRSQPFKLQNR